MERFSISEWDLGVRVQDEPRMIMDVKKNTWYRCSEMMRGLAEVGVSTGGLQRTAPKLSLRSSCQERLPAFVLMFFSCLLGHVTQC